MDRNLNELLKWSIEHSAPSNNTNGVTAHTNGDAPPADGTQVSNAAATSSIDPAVMAALFGGPSEAELMKAAMAVITDPDPEVTLENKLIAFDNFEQLIESLDNANNLEDLNLWAPLLGLLDHDEDQLRLMAAWCLGTAVQNNAKTQERLHALGGIPRLVNLATNDNEPQAVRRKAIYALSSAVRNYQPAMDDAIKELAPAGHHSGERVDANDMDAIDEIMNGLKQRAEQQQASS
ncbi:nucleotide exchange factor Fes1-domain-containing protein [Diplogelasinospora grovesii]|uniref:Nucleotide exchange factor Fes1-domain-containing protein n=1 Tax=Diplogelasinospora grovesii TaxID=303347 RepID=A0AAN6S8X3_9PEZI|nr:nucleotide exchange factor Fes1-domain-containing protein [Diplogelasinospora grovesii]